MNTIPADVIRNLIARGFPPHVLDDGTDSIGVAIITPDGGSVVLVCDGGDDTADLAASILRGDYD